MVLITYIAAAFIAFRLLLGLIGWLIQINTVEVPTLEYCTKNLSHYEADFQQIKDLISRANNYDQIKALFDVIYTFRLRYRRFKRYGVNVEEKADDLIRLIDQRLTALNSNTPKNKILTLFFNQTT